MPRIQIYDTTLRDGTQGEGVSFSLQDKLLITQRLDSLGFDYVEGGYPLSNEKDVQYFQRIRELELQHAKVCAFGMTRRRGVSPAQDAGMRALVDSGAPVATLVGKTWDFHVREVLRVSLNENLAMIAESVDFLRQSQRQVIYDAEHFFDGWKANRDYALQTISAAVTAGAGMIVLCDTNGGTLPDEVGAITRQVRELLTVPVAIHCHNDCDVAVANSLAAVEAGAVQVQGTINGLGERCGNADLISVIANLAVKMQGFEVLLPGSVAHLTELSRYVYELANMNLRPNQPFVGQSAFAHKGGMHVHAVNRDTSTYEHIAPETVGNERRVLVSELSGRSNIAALATKFSIGNDELLLGRILAEVVKLENQGYQFEAAEGSFDLLIKKCSGNYRPHFERLSYHVSTEVNAQQEITTEATVKVRVGSRIKHEVAEGDGPVNALDAALRKALGDEFPNLADMELVDYKVRVINGEAGTAAKVRVMIESRDRSDIWGTVGVSENIIEASWMALVDSFEYKLFKDEGKSRGGVRNGDKAAAHAAPAGAPAGGR
jgi:2-isopropylmalate synthase